MRKMIINLLNKVEKLVSDFEGIYEMLQEVKELYEREFEENDGIVELPEIGEYALIGDLHGDYESLRTILLKLDKAKLLHKDGKIIFLGDYIDRGPQQLRVILTVFMLKKEFNEQVITLRGNHEPPQWLIPYPHDFPEIIQWSFGNVKGNILYSQFFSIFQKLPYAAIIKNNALLVHGGPPTINIDKANNLDIYLNIKKSPYSRKILEEILWNDPVEADVISYPSPRGAGSLFGTKVTEKVLDSLKVKIIIRAHEPTNGIKLSHKGKVVTVFSMKGYYFNEKAAFLFINTEEKHWVRNLKRAVYYY